MGVRSADSQRGWGFPSQLIPHKRRLGLPAPATSGSIFSLRTADHSEMLDNLKVWRHSPARHEEPCSHPIHLNPSHSTYNRRHRRQDGRPLLDR